MRASTNSLITKLKRFAVPLSTTAVLLFATSFFLLGRSTVHAAGAEQPQINQSSIAPLTSLDDAVEAVTAHVMPAVVNVSVTARVNRNENGGQFGGINPQDLPPEFRHFFFFGPGNGNGEGQGQGQPQFEHGIGSGVIISSDGYIITNHHVVDNAKQIQVTLHDRRTFPAKVIGIDKLNDLAIIKIDATGLPTVSWGDSTALKPGQTVMAFGSPFGTLQFSVTRGIVSAVHRGGPSSNRRVPQDFIQTDAAINPGNSGGPLVNSHGQVVGIDTFIISNSGSFAGAGFAIPSQIAQHSANEIIKTGTVHHGYLGISIQDVNPETASFFKVPTAAGAIVGQVTPDSPASRAGLKQGDVIRKLNNKEIVTSSDLQVAVSEMSPGTPIELSILRDGNPMTLKATVGEYHASGQEAENNGSGQGQHARLGLSLQDLSPDLRKQMNIPDDVHGAFIQSVRAGSPADNAQLQPGEVVTEVDHKPVTSAQNFVDQVHAIPAGKPILLLVWSKQGTGYIVVHPEEGGNSGNSNNSNQ